MDLATAEATRVMLANVWQRSLPAMYARLESVEAAASALNTGTLTETLREQAISNAHKLSGSLGMFGYLNGTDLAREIETLLASDAPNAQTLCTLTAALRASVFPGL